MFGGKIALEQIEAQLHAAEQMVEKSRMAGKRGRWEEVQSYAKDALSALKPAEHCLAKLSSCENVNELDENNSIEMPLTSYEMLTVSALGYMGFGLMKQSRYNEALPLLEQSIKRSSTVESKTEDAPTVRRLHREAIAAQQAYSLCQEQVEHMKHNPLVKYPRTAHLFDTGGTAATADDLILPDNDAAYTVLCDGRTNVVIEEKMDGANLGISFDPLTQDFLVQNRSHYISSGEHAQFSRITEFIEAHREALHQILCTNDYIQNGSLILFGEWLAARHSVPYHTLPGLFVAYDLFGQQNEGSFFSRTRFHTIMKGSGIPVAPVIDTRTFGPYTQKQKQDGLFRSELVGFLDTKSAFRNDQGTVEGVVLRVDDSGSLWNRHRYKIVRPDFVQGCNDGHWSSRQIEKQRVDFEFAMDYINDCCVLAGSDENCIIAKEETTLSHSKCKKPPVGSISREAREYRKQRARARRQVPRCVMLMGLPGSGKSTFANQLAASNPDKNVVVNQDRLGKKKCIELACKASRKNRIILDRCNPTEAERREWHNIVGSPSKNDCTLVYFAANEDTCVERVQNRTNHETIPLGRGERIVKRVATTLEPPSNSDSNLFGTIEIVNNVEESSTLLHKWGVDDAQHVE